MTATTTTATIISHISSLANATLPERMDIMRSLAFEASDLGDPILAESARILWATHRDVATSGTDNETLCALDFGRAIINRLNLRVTEQGVPLQHWLYYMANHGPEAQPEAVRRYIYSHDNGTEYIRKMAAGAFIAPPLRADDIKQASALLPGMEEVSADTPVVVCPHCTLFTPVHTALLLGNAHIHGAYHCPHCGRLAWWRAFDPVTGALEPQVNICAAVLTDVPTPMNRPTFHAAIKNDTVDADALPFLYVDTDSHMADSAHPWHMHLFHLDSIEFEQLDRLDDAYFATCARCAAPEPCRDVTADGRIDEDGDPDGWDAKISSSDNDLSDIEYRSNHSVHDLIICEDCRDDIGSCCEHCGVYVDDDDIVTVHARGYDSYECEECAHDRHYRCVDCGEWFHEELMHQDYAGDWYCSSCIEDHYDEPDDDDTHHRIHEYGYKPTPIKHGNGINDPASKMGGAGASSYYFGLELEHSSEDEQFAMAEMFCNSVCDDEKYFYMKHDSSVDTGIEFVSHPVTLAAWQDTFSKAQACLRAICDIAARYSYDRENDGFHIHLSRSAFYLPHDDAKGKKSWNVRHRACFDAFFNRIVKHPDAQRIIGRKEVHWGHGNPQGRSLGSVVTKFTRHEPYERYRAVNWNNRPTAEVRIFHSTDDLDAILACIEMVDAVLNFTHPRRGGATQSQITGSKYPVEWLWDTFAEWVVLRESQYPHLAAALVEA